MLDALAFLPLQSIEEGLSYLKEVFLEILQDLLFYCNSTFISGTLKHVTSQTNMGLISKFKRHSPLFPKEM